MYIVLKDNKKKIIPFFLRNSFFPGFLDIGQHGYPAKSGTCEYMNESLRG